MSFLNRLQGILVDPPPEFVFEISGSGIAYVRPDVQQPAFEPLADDVLSISPLRDNVLRPEVFTTTVQALVPPTGTKKRRRAVLILPDYCARVAVLEFDAFPAEPAEQLALVRFRLKKSVPFEVESAAIAFYPQESTNAKGVKRFDVVVVAASMEVVARYEAPFRGAGLQVGVITTSLMAALEMEKDDGITLLAKMTGTVLTVAAVRAGVLRMVRCVELEPVNTDSVLGVLFPTVALVEDEMAARPDRVVLCGFGSAGEIESAQWAGELGIPFETLRSSFGVPGPYNAGLLGYLESPEAGRV
jgi:type IV pilus assembly protein PilM